MYKRAEYEVITSTQFEGKQRLGEPDSCYRPCGNEKST